MSETLLPYLTERPPNLKEQLDLWIDAQRRAVQLELLSELAWRFPYTTDAERAETVARIVQPLS